jgi:hypothetical protein
LLVYRKVKRLKGVPCVKGKWEKANEKDNDEGK